MNHVVQWKKSTLSQKDWLQRPWVSAFLGRLRNVEEASVAGVKSARGEVVGDGFRNLIDHMPIMGHDDDILMNNFILRMFYILAFT